MSVAVTQWKLAMCISCLRLASLCIAPIPSRAHSPDSLKQKTYPADCRKIAAVDSNKHDWD